MKSINQDIKNNEFRQIYLLYGEEDYLRKHYKIALTKGMVDENSMNYSFFEGKNLNVGEIIQMAETLPFFSERRLVVVENSGFFKSANEDLVNYLNVIPKTTHFIFVEKDIDRRGKFYKTVKSNGYVCELNSPGNNELIQWVMKYFQISNKKISAQVADYIIQTVGTDMVNLINEMEKLICYTLDKEYISDVDVDEICVQEIMGKIFEMIDAMSFRKAEKLFQLYYDLIETKEPPMRILFMVIRQFKIMLQVKELKNKGYSDNHIADEIKLKQFVVKKVASQLLGFKGRSLRKMLEQCAETEEMIKTGGIDERIGLEMLLADFVQ